MALIGGTGGGCGDSTDISGTSGTVSYVTTPVKTGTYAMRSNPTTTNTGHFEVRKFQANGLAVDLGLSRIYTKIDFRYATKPSSNDEVIIATNGAAKPSVRINSSGNLVLYDSTNALVATGTAVLSQDTWYEIQATWGQNTDSCAVIVDGVTDITAASVSCGSAATQRMRYGKSANSNGNTVDFFYDNILIGDTQITSGAAIMASIPASDISVSQWSSGTGTTYAEIDEIPASNADYLMSNGSANDAFLCGIASMDTRGVPAGATFLGLFVRGRYRENTGTPTSGTQLNVKSGSTTSSTTARDGTTTVASSSILLETDPNTSAAWTRSALDAVQVGMTETTTTQVWCTSIICQIVYVPSTASAKPFFCIAA